MHDRRRGRCANALHMQVRMRIHSSTTSHPQPSRFLPARSVAARRSPPPAAPRARFCLRPPLPRRASRAESPPELCTSPLASAYAKPHATSTSASTSTSTRTSTSARTRTSTSYTLCATHYTSHVNGHQRPATRYTLHVTSKTVARAVAHQPPLVN